MKCGAISPRFKVRRPSGLNEAGFAHREEWRRSGCHFVFQAMNKAESRGKMEKMKRIVSLALALLLLCTSAFAEGIESASGLKGQMTMEEIQALNGEAVKAYFRGLAGDYQSDERAGVARLSWRVSGR